MGRGAVAEDERQVRAALPRQQQDSMPRSCRVACQGPLPCAAHYRRGSVAAGACAPTRMWGALGVRGATTGACACPVPASTAQHIPLYTGAGIHPAGPVSPVLVHFPPSNTHQHHQQQQPPSSRDRPEPRPSPHRSLGQPLHRPQPWTGHPSLQERRQQGAGGLLG